MQPGVGTTPGSKQISTTARALVFSLALSTKPTTVAHCSGSAGPHIIFRSYLDLNSDDDGASLFAVSSVVFGLWSWWAALSLFPRRPLLLRKVPPKLAAGAHPPVMLRCNLLIPHVRHPRVACREGAICSSFLSASIHGGAAEPGAVATQFPAAAPAVKGAGYTPDRRGYTPAPPGGL